MMQATSGWTRLTVVDDATLAEARDERMRARDLVKQGINPAHERQRARLRRDQDGATTFESVTREWLAMKDWEEITKARRLNMLQRVVFGKIGTLPFKQVSPLHILDVLGRLEQSSSLCRHQAPWWA